MKYSLLIYGDETQGQDAPQDQIDQVMEQWWKYEAWLQERGIKIAGEALQPTNTATTVQVKNDQTVTTDGPFAETKEQLGGFYLIDVANLDEALEAAAKCPGAVSGKIEVRAVMEFEAPQ
jgi:hypothetical protein